MSVTLNGHIVFDTFNITLLNFGFPEIASMATNKIWAYCLPNQTSAAFEHATLGTSLSEIDDNAARTKSKKFEIVYPLPWDICVLNSPEGLQGWVAYYEQALELKLKYDGRVKLWPADEFLNNVMADHQEWQTPKQVELLTLLRLTRKDAYVLLNSLESHAELRAREALKFPSRAPQLGDEFVKELFLSPQQPVRSSTERVDTTKINDLTHRIRLDEMQIAQLCAEIDAQFEASATAEQNIKRIKQDMEKTASVEVLELKKKLKDYANLSQQLKSRETDIKLAKMQLAQLHHEIQLQIKDNLEMKEEIIATSTTLKRISSRL